MSLLIFAPICISSSWHKTPSHITASSKNFYLKAANTSNHLSSLAKYYAPSAISRYIQTLPAALYGRFAHSILCAPPETFPHVSLYFHTPTSSLWPTKTSNPADVTSIITHNFYISILSCRPESTGLPKRTARPPSKCHRTLMSHFTAWTPIVLVSSLHTWCAARRKNI